MARDKVIMLIRIKRKKSTLKAFPNKFDDALKKKRDKEKKKK